MNLRYIDWIWHVRGSIALAPGQSSDDVYGRLAPLFHQPGTRYEQGEGTLTFRKKDQAAQDRMSIFDGGVLRIEQGLAGFVLRYHLTSRALLFCFLAPLLFLSLAQLTIFINSHHAPKPALSKEEQQKVDAAKNRIRPLNPIDKFLGAPEPEKPGKKKGADEAGGGDKKPTPTPAYVFAGIFAVLYVVGRILEEWLVKRLFDKRLRSSGR